MGDDLAAWLLEQIAEDERRARAFLAIDSSGDALNEIACMAGHTDKELWDVGYDHFELHQPKRVLAECDAKRRIVDSSLRDPLFVGCDTPTSSHDLGHLLKLLALPYVDRADYREEWRP